MESIDILKYFIKIGLMDNDITDLKSVVGPGAKLHYAGLLVEGEVLDVDLAGGLVDGGRAPLHAPRIVQSRLRRQRHLKVAVRAAQHVTKK